MPLYPRTGNYGLASLLNQALAQPADYRPWPGFRHPCRNDGFSGLPGLVYNGESWSLGTSQTTEKTLIQQHWRTTNLMRLNLCSEVSVSNVFLEDK